jgi:hypothetical protein
VVSAMDPESGLSGRLPHGRCVRHNYRKQSFHIEISRSPPIGSFRNANKCKYSWYISHGVMVFACSRGDHFLGRRSNRAGERGEFHSKHDLHTVPSGRGANASESMD